MPKAKQNNCTRVQLGGTAFYGPATNNFFFAPDDPRPDTILKGITRGTAQQLSDGTFEFVAKPSKRSEATRIRKLAHGCASLTKDGAFLLTIKVYQDEDICISDAMLSEAIEAVEAIREYQLKR